jgi:hypothetical protein
MPGPLTLRLLLLLVCLLWWRMVKRRQSHPVPGQSSIANGPPIPAAPPAYLLGGRPHLAGTDLDVIESQALEELLCLGRFRLAEPNVVIAFFQGNGFRVSGSEEVDRPPRAICAPIL